MVYVYIGIPLLILIINLYFFYYIKRIYKIKNIILQHIKKLSDFYTITVLKHKHYEIEVELEDKLYLIKILNVHKPVVITNKDTWILSENGQILIKNQLLGMKQFLNIPQNEKSHKIVIVYPKMNVIRQYVNEHEMIFIDSKTKVYDTYVIDYRDIYENFFINENL